jgi:predicted Zn-dependent protease
MAQVGDDPELAAIVKMARDERWPEAERRLQELLGEQPDHHEALVEMGLLQLRQRHDPQAARPYFKQALQLEPEDELLVRQYLQTFDAVDELEQGVAALQEFRQRYGSSAAIDETLGDMLLLRDEPQAAIELLEAARARQQSRADAPDIRLGQQLARAYLDAGRVDDGIFLLRELIARTEHPLPLKRLKLKLAAAYLQSGQRAAAIAVFDEMAREFPADELISKIRRDIRTGRL